MSPWKLRLSNDDDKVMLGRLLKPITKWNLRLSPSLITTVALKDLDARNTDIPLSAERRVFYSTHTVMFTWVIQYLCSSNTACQDSLQFDCVPSFSSSKDVSLKLALVMVKA